MTILLPLLMAYNLIGEATHEWIGTSMLILFIVHHILNYQWFSTLFKGHYRPVRIVNTAVNLILLIDILFQGISGIIMSRQVFSFLNIQQGASFVRVVHLLGAYWGFVLMSIHIGLHWNAIVIPPELEEKMKNDPELAQKVMNRINNFILTNEASEPGTLKGYVMTFDENGEINHACVVGEGRITHSVSGTGREKVDKLHEEYERIAEENALKRKLLQQEIEEKYYQSKIAKEAVSDAYEANVLTEPIGNSGFDSGATGAI